MLAELVADPNSKSYLNKICLIKFWLNDLPEANNAI